MSRKRKHITGCTVAICLAFLGGAGGAGAPSDQAQAFATCIGRYTALRDFGWLIGNANPVAETRRALFEDLLEAVLDDAQQDGLSGPELLNMRIAARLAQSRLLSLAQLEPGNTRAARAKAMAYREMRVCDAMILG